MGYLLVRTAVWDLFEPGLVAAERIVVVEAAATARGWTVLVAAGKDCFDIAVVFAASPVCWAVARTAAVAVAVLDQCAILQDSENYSEDSAVAGSAAVGQGMDSKNSRPDLHSVTLVEEKLV